MVYFTGESSPSYFTHQKEKTLYSNFNFVSNSRGNSPNDYDSSSRRQTRKYKNQEEEAEN